MGSLDVSKLSNAKDKANYIYHLTRDIKALEMMIDKGMIEKSPIRIGAEQEFCLVNNEFLPTDNSLELLEAINDEAFTTEIGSFNLEINLDPFKLEDDCFSKLHKQLETLLDKAKEKALSKQTKIVLTGILPTLTQRMISIEHMTPIKRYAVLNEAIKESRKEEFYIHIKGVDELNILSDSVMLEGCNTSFQMHLQINPDNFIDSYNWAQAISGPILSICTNSPLLFGKELWSETRIALFTQSVDTRTNSFLLNEKQSRVSFGNNWETGSVADIFKDNVSRFRSLVTSTFEKDSVAMVENGEVPKLTALNLHNGTVYRWNRVCYGVGNNKPHLRIENRYIPSGPTTTDEIANMVFWVGVMSGRPKQYENIHEKMDFKDIKANFFNAARYGMYAQFSWNDKIVSAKSLLEQELLPMAYEGLSKLGVSKVDATYYLKIIEDRLISNDGSRWISKSYRNLLKLKKPFEAAQILTSHLYENQDNGSTIDSWEILHKDTKPKYSSKKVVKHLMNTDIFSVDEEDSIELVLNIMQWKNIHHLPVIDHEKKIIGLLLWKDIEKFIHNQEKLKDNVKTIMRTGIITTSQYTTIDKAKEKMQHYKIDCLPVVEQNRLIGIITLKDF